MSNAQTRNPLTQQTNGTSNPRSENDYLAPAKVNSLRTRKSDLSNASDPDSLLDLYKQPSNSALRSKSAGMRATRKNSTQASAGAKAPEQREDYWIHRDKLAQIESRELEEAGLRIGRRASENNFKREEKRQRLASPARIEGEPESYEGASDVPVTTPPKSLLPKANGTRGVNSRIPVPRGGPSPPEGGTRSRTGSIGVTNSLEHSPSSQPSRQASRNDPYDAGTPSPPESPQRNDTSSTSVNKVTSPQKKTGARGPRKPPTNRTASNPKQRTPPSTVTRQNTDPKRPGTSSGTPRPSTSHLTEVEPPWLATMYKPDPRLPPDQQMLPTHAKRLAQEQWEKEGKTGTVYDREFRLLNAEAFPEKPPMEEPKLDSPLRSNADDFIKTSTLSPKHWSMGHTPPPASPRSIAGSIRPGTSGTDHGGYRTMPTISRAPTPNAKNQQAANPAPIRLMDYPDDEDEKGRKKGGCAGCGCVIM